VGIFWERLYDTGNLRNTLLLVTPTLLSIGLYKYFKRVFSLTRQIRVNGALMLCFTLLIYGYNYLKNFESSTGSGIYFTIILIVAQLTITILLMVACVH